MRFAIGRRALASFGTSLARSSGASGLYLLARIATLQKVELVAGQRSTMLELAHNDAWRHADGDGKARNVPVVCSKSKHLAFSRFGQYPVYSKLICFFFSRISGRSIPINESLASVEKQVSDLVENSEPEMVVRAMPKAQQEHGSIGFYHPTGTTRAAAAWRGSDYQRDARLSEEVAQPRDETIQPPDIR